MPKVKLSPVIMEIHGQMGGMVFRRTWKGETTLIKKADMSGVKWSKAQAAHRQRFRKAVAFAKKAMADPQLKKAYEKAGAKKGKRAFEMAVSDYFQQQKK